MPLLRDFIKFAKREPRAIAEAYRGSVGDADSPFEEAVTFELKRPGWTAVPQAGGKGTDRTGFDVAEQQGGEMPAPSPAEERKAAAFAASGCVVMLCATGLINTVWRNVMNDRITLYGSFTSSSSYKPMLYLALARLPFSFRTVNLKKDVQKTPEYLAVNRYGQVPSIRHQGLTILQSNVILDYLARTTGHFEGASEQERWQAREWLSWEADAITNVAKVRHYSRFMAVDPAVMDYFKPLAEAALSFIDTSLAGRSWLVGERCTIADIGCWGRMVFMAEGGFEIARWPNLLAWSERLKAMPGFALPYDLIPKKDAEFDPGRHQGDERP